MNEDTITISAVHRLGDAIGLACGGRYEAALDCLIEAVEDLETLRDTYELALDEDEPLYETNATANKPIYQAMVRCS